VFVLFMDHSCVSHHAILLSFVPTNRAVLQQFSPQHMIMMNWIRWKIVWTKPLEQKLWNI
jgi:hypothetical protein